MRPRIALGPGRALGLHALLVEDPLHQRALVVRVVDDEVAADADRLAVAAQDPGAQGVERAGLDVPAGPLADEGDDPVAQLPGGPIREGDREDLPGRHAAHADEVGDPMGQHARLARARAGQDEDRAVRRRHGSRLLRVEVGGDARREGLRRRDPFLRGGRRGRDDGLGRQRRVVHDERGFGRQGGLMTQVEPAFVRRPAPRRHRPRGGRRAAAGARRGGRPAGPRAGLRPGRRRHAGHAWSAGPSGRRGALGGTFRLYRRPLTRDADGSAGYPATRVRPGRPAAGR